jgi:hypothetical protein
MIKQMGTTMKKKMALNDGESKIHGCQRFSFISTPLWSNTAASRVTRDGFNFFGVTGHSG